MERAGVTYLLYPAIWVVGAIFGAGGAWAIFARMQRDVNALGRVVRRDRWNHMLADMVIHEKREDRQRIADLMRE